MIDLKNNPNVKFWPLFNFHCCCGNYDGRQNRLKIKKLLFWTKLKAFEDFASKEYHFKNIFDFTTAGDWDWVTGTVWRR